MSRQLIHPVTSPVDRGISVLAFGGNLVPPTVATGQEEKEPGLHFSLEDIGKRVRAARKALKWSQERLAREADLATITVNRLETGSRPVGDEEAQHILSTVLAASAAPKRLALPAPEATTSQHPAFPPSLSMADAAVAVSIATGATYTADDLMEALFLLKRARKAEEEARAREGPERSREAGGELPRAGMKTGNGP